MSIAGSDSSAGAGIQADLKTFTKLGCFGLTVITSVTAQNTNEVLQVHNLPNDIIYQQIHALSSDIDICSVKIGMLATINIIKTVVKAIDDFSLRKIIIDPVMIATSGDTLIDQSAIKELKNQLIPRASLVTPNIFEAEILTGMKITSLSEMEKAAKQLCKLGPPNVLIKGGHLRIKNQSVDVMETFQGTQYFRTPYVYLKKIHGTGCVLSAAIASYVALGYDFTGAMKKSKKFIYKSIKKSHRLGQGAWILG